VTLDPLKQHYEDYWRRPEPAPLGDPLASVRLRLLEEELERVRAQRILDAGCGAGQLVGELAARGYDATGIDVAGAAFALAPSGVELVEHSVEQLPWPVEHESVDVVVSFEVIEHLLRPDLLVAGAFDVLRPGGYVALTTPYHGLVKNLAIAVSAFDKHYDVVGDHVRFFSDRSLAALVRGTGFEIERIRHFGRFAPVWAGTFVWARKAPR
jgi:2-polyprenyl-3-methyl-5-hydroxy-6-metoxy-1,4-benzoquinol methylase